MLTLGPFYNRVKREVSRAVFAPLVFADLFARAAAICKANLIKPYIKTGACPGPEGGKMRGEGKRR